MQEDVNILLVEDDVGDAELTRTALKTAKINVALHVVHDGDAALHFLRRQTPYQDAVRPDLVLLDLNLPRINGRDVLRELKGNAALRSIPVIILTTSESGADISACYDLGANCYLVKPIGFEAFLKTVNAINDFWFTQVKLPPRGKE